MHNIKDIFDEKDIFELLNDVNINENEYDFLEPKTNQLKKKALKNNLKKQIKNKDLNKKYRYIAVAVVAICILGSSFMTNPTFAQKIPVISSIIQSLNDKQNFHIDYYKYTNELQKSVTDKNLTVTINEVVCDDSTLIIGYKITGIKKLKDMLVDKSIAIPHIQWYLYKINDKTLESSSSSDTGGYTDDYTYVGTREINIANANAPTNFNFDFSISNISGVEGNWHFNFDVSKAQAKKNTRIFNPHTKADLKDSIININKVSFSPISTTIAFDGKSKESNGGISKYTGWFVFDDRGVELLSKGGTCEIKGQSLSEFEGQLDLYNIKKTPKYLTIIPYTTIELGTDTKYSIDLFNGTYPKEISQGKIGKLIIKDVKFMQSKTVVYYTSEGIAPYSQAVRLYIKDENDNVINSHNDLNIRKDEDKPNEYTKEFDVLDKNKKYKFVTDSFDNYEVLTDLKFKIPLEK